MIFLNSRQGTNPEGNFLRNAKKSLKFKKSSHGIQFMIIYHLKE